MKPFLKFLCSKSVVSISSIDKHKKVFCSSYYSLKVCSGGLGSYVLWRRSTVFSSFVPQLRSIVSSWVFGVLFWSSLLETSLVLLGPVGTSWILLGLGYLISTTYGNSWVLLGTYWKLLGLLMTKPHGSPLGLLGPLDSSGEHKHALEDLLGHLELSLLLMRSHYDEIALLEDLFWNTYFQKGLKQCLFVAYLY